MTEPDDQEVPEPGSRAANQAKAEEFPPGAGDDRTDDDEQADAREDTDVGAEDPQAPRPAD